MSAILPGKSESEVITIKIIWGKCEINYTIIYVIYLTFAWKHLYRISLTVCNHYLILLMPIWHDFWWQKKQTQFFKELFSIMVEHPKDTFYFDRRSGRDRRSNGVPEIKSLFIYGRRKSIRRNEDKYKNSYFDQYSTGLFVAVVSILILSMADALLTLFLIDNGATEINPVMAYFINLGPYTFISVKYFLTCFSLIVLLILNNVYLSKLKIHTRTLFSYAIGVFVIVIGWELFLSFRILFWANS